MTTRPTLGKRGAGRLDRPPTAWPLLIVVAISSCAPLSTIGTYDRPPSICSRVNHRATRVQVVLEDELRHIEWVGNADPGGHVCTSWTLPGNLGRWGYLTTSARGAAIDTTWGLWFQAWALSR